MRNSRWAVCGLLLALAACVDAPAPRDPVDDDEVTTVEARSVTPLASGPASTDTETCTTTQSACKVGRCELGANDTFVTITEVCCTAPGVCVTERYKLCGC